MTPFDYPQSAHATKHGPAGYENYSSYRPWLRDEFVFRCVYCLKREKWGRVTGEFDLDHFQPQVLNPSGILDYDNLRYACRGCNQTKRDVTIPDPCQHLTKADIRILPDGTMEGRTIDAERLIRILDLNSPRAIEWRITWMRVVELAEEYDAQLHRQLMGFPDDLPNLSRLRPPNGNTRIEGIRASCFTKRARGSLPDVY